LGHDSGTLDSHRWQALWSRLGGQGPGLEVLHRLADAYADPARAYHTAAHINDCLGQWDWSHELAVRPHEVEAALWFHDAVYLPGAFDNEEQSSRLAQAALTSGGVSPPVAYRIAELILATDHLTIPSDPDAQLLCDIDLSVLGRDQGEFDEFERRIRREYAWLPEQAYRSGRSAVLNRFLARSAIYQTEPFVQRYEAQARWNLKRLLADLSR